jgi:hypothetical protein
MVEQLQDGVDVVLGHRVRLEQVQEQQTGTLGRLSILHDRVRGGRLTLPVDQSNGWPVAGEVEERAGPGQLAERLRPEVPLQSLQGQGTDVADIDPGTNHHQGVRLPQFGTGLGELKRTDSHVPPILPRCVVHRHVVAPAEIARESGAECETLCFRLQYQAQAMK